MHALAAGSLLTLWPGAAVLRAQTLPSGMLTVAGQATARTVGNTLTITNTPNTILNWNSFSIGAHSAVRFDQASVSSQVLNRVTGKDPSSILGSLSSNGRVWLLNPNGVLFGQGARVDVAGLVTSTLNLNDADWLAGRYRFTQGSAPAADIVNQGDLRSSLGGRVALIGGTVRNEGDVTAPGGQIVLAAGSDVELVDTATPNIGVKVNAGEGNVVNLGRLLAAGGRIDIHAATVNQDGIVRADTLKDGPGGEVMLVARDQLNLDAASQTAANGDAGGNITLQADRTLVQGTISATGSQGSGGRVQLLGRQVGVLDGAHVDASGAGGGGEVLVGGGAQGKDKSVPNAQAVYFGSRANIRADATSEGDGGHVVLWSDQATRAYGSLSARGGPLGGNGGLIETSGGWLDARPASLRTDAPAGRAGTWLLDPNDILINDSNDLIHATDGPNFTTTDDAAVIGSGQIISALDAGNNVTITTGSARTNSQPGDITMSGADIIIQPPHAVSLTLTASRNITIDGSNIGTSGNPLNLALYAGEAGNGGGILIQNSTITAGYANAEGAPLVGGSIYLGGHHAPSSGGFKSPFQGAVGADGRLGNLTSGVQIVNSTLAVGSDNGSIGIFGNSIAPGANGYLYGVLVDGRSVLTGADIVLHGWIASDAPDSKYGVDVGGQIDASRKLDIQGQALTTTYFPNDGEGSVNYGVAIDGGAILNVGDPNCNVAANCTLTINGTSQAGIGVAGGGIYSSGLVVDGTIKVTQPTAVNFGGTAIGGDVDAEWAALFDRGSTLNLAGASSTTFTTPLWTPGTVSDIGLHGNVILPSGGQAWISGGEDVYLQGTITGSPSLFHVFGGNTIHLRGNFNSPGSQTIALKGGAQVEFYAPEVHVGSSLPGYTFALTTDGRVFTFADTLVFRNSGSLTSTFGGDAVIFAGYSTGFISDFAFEGATGNELSTPKGRWLVYAADPTVNFDSGKLPYQFRQYDAAGAPPAQANGNGLLFEIAPVLAANLPNGVTIDKVYDGTTVVPGPNPTLQLSGFVNGDSAHGVPPSYLSLGFVDKNAGIGRPVVFGGLTLPAIFDSNQLPVYGYGVRSDVTGNITPRPLAVSGVSANNKVYDATTAATLSGAPTVVPLANDVVSVAGAPTAAFADKNVGKGKPVSVAGYTLAGADAGNYTVVQPAGLSADITSRPLAVSGVSANSKVYDATTVATLGGAPAVAALGNDAVSVAGTPTAAFADKNVGTAKPVSVSGYTLAGADAGNYTVVQPAGLSADITAATLTVAGVSAANKVYDATTAVSLSGAPVIAPFAGDAVSLTGAVAGSFADKNAGIAKPVVLSGLGLAGADAGNYVLGLSTSLSADITPRTLAISGVNANSKVYDATTAAALSGAPTVVPMASDVVSVAGTPTAAFADKNVGTAKPVSVAGYTLAGADAGNYAVVQPAGLSADITPRPLAVSGVNANNKVYDATTAATLAGAPVVAALGNDVVSVAGTPTATFADKNVGTAKPVGVAGYTLAGADAGNYAVVQPAGLSADITAATLTVTGVSAANKVYDASASATLSGTATVTPLPGDAVTVTGTPQGSFSDPNVGIGKTVGIIGLALAGADAANYALPASVTVTAAIDPATLHYLATPVTQPAGTPLPALSGTVYGFVGGQTMQSATTGTLTFTTTATEQWPAGVYPILGGGLSAINYVFAQDPGNATALTFTGMSPAIETVAASTAAPWVAQQLTAKPLSVPDPYEAGLANLLVPPRRPSSSAMATAGFQAFAPVDLGSLSPDAVVGLLDARERYKQSIFADSIARLEQDPTLADLPACQSPQDLTSGTCLMTPELKREIKAASPGKALAAPSLAAPGGETTTDKSAATPAGAAAPAAAPPLAATPAPAPATPSAPATAGTAVATAPAVANLPAVLLNLPTPRVKVANLPQIVRKVALVIGENQYSDASIPPLASAVGDARAIGRVFESQLGYESIVLENASKETIVAALNRLALELNPQDSIVIYYAGHGELVEPAARGELSTSGGMGYWIPSNSDANRPETWLSNADIGRLVRQFDASQVALISDSCYSGSLVTGERIRATPGPMDPQQVLARKSVVVMSSGGNEPVADTGKDGHSPFAWFLMNDLSRVAKWQPGGNIFERVRFAVARELPQRPQYGSYGQAGHETGGDYLFEERQLESAPK